MRRWNVAPQPRISESPTTRSPLVKRKPEMDGPTSGLRIRPIEMPVATKPEEERPNYKVICISLYTADLDHLDATVESLKASGHSKMSRSGLIRMALEQFDVSRMKERDKPEG